MTQIRNACEVDIWIDSSSLAAGVSMEINESVIKDVLVVSIK